MGNGLQEGLVILSFFIGPQFGRNEIWRVWNLLEWKGAGWLRIGLQKEEIGPKFQERPYWMCCPLMGAWWPVKLAIWGEGLNIGRIVWGQISGLFGGTQGVLRGHIGGGKWGPQQGEGFLLTPKFWGQREGIFGPATEFWVCPNSWNTSWPHCWFQGIEYPHYTESDPPIF